MTHDKPARSPRHSNRSNYLDQSNQSTNQSNQSINQSNQPSDHSIHVQIPVLHEKPKRSRRRRQSTLRPSLNEHLLTDHSESESETPNYRSTHQSTNHRVDHAPITPSSRFKSPRFRNRQHSIITSHTPHPSNTPSNVTRNDHVHQSINQSSSFWPGTHELRRVFRSFDRDCDGLISIGELRLGLAAMGFDVVHTANLSRLTSEMNADSNGQIKESSFVRVFRKLNREKIVDELKASAAEHEEQARLTQCVVVDIEQETNETNDASHNRSPNESVNQSGDSLGDSDELPRLFMREERMSPSALATFLLPSTPTLGRSTTRKLRWIDCIGVHAATLSFLSNHFSLPPSCFDPALLTFDSAPHLSYSYEPMHGNGVLSVLMHVLSLDPVPNVNRKSPYHFFRGSTDKHVNRSLTCLPVHVIVIGDHTLITIHPLTRCREESDLFVEFRTLLQASISQDVPLASPFASTIHTTTNQSLAVELMDELTDWNWSMRDEIYGWKNDLEARLSQRCQPSMLDEIHTIQAVSLQAQRAISKMSAMLEVVVEEEDKYEMQHSHQSGTTDTNQPATGIFEARKHRMTHSQSMSSTFINQPVSENQSVNQSINHSLKIDLTLRQSRHMFLTDIRRDFRALSANNTRLYADLKFAHDLIVPLVGYYRQRRDEETNAILYLLTVLTALVTPLQVSSSIYGMNFQSMPEQAYEHSYLIFWIANIVIVICIAFLFRRKGWL